MSSDAASKSGVGSATGATSERSWLRGLPAGRPGAKRKHGAGAGADGQAPPRKHFIEPAFSVGVRKHGRGKVLFSWNSDSTFLASTGVSKVVHIYSRQDNTYSLHRQVSRAACELHPLRSSLAATAPCSISLPPRPTCPTCPALRPTADYTPWRLRVHVS